MQSAENVRASKSDRKAILILGMHRSGTSALGGVVNALGATAPRTLAPAQPDNPRGFYESLVLVQANNALLASAGSRSDDWRALNPQWTRSAAATTHRQSIKDALRDEFGDAPLFFIKDPRICRLVPFYLSALREMGVGAVALLPLRNPLEVAHSLKKRDGLPLWKSLLLWLRHVLEAEYHSRHLPRCFLLHEKVLLDWRPQMERAATCTGLIWPAHSHLTDAAIDQFLTLDLHRERATTQDMEQHPDVTALVSETYAALSAMAAGDETNELIDRLDTVRTKFEEGCKTFGGAIAAAEGTAEDLHTELGRRTAAAEEHLAAAREEHARRQQQLDEVQAALTQRQQQLAETQAALAEKQQQLDASSAALADQQRETREAGMALAERHRQFEESQAALAQQRHRTDHAEAAVAQQRRQIEEAQAALEHHQGQARDAATTLARQSSLLSDQEAEIRRHIADRDAILADRTRILTSRSWRWTAPLRRVRQLGR